MKKILKQIKYLVEYLLFLLLIGILKLLGINKASAACGLIARKIGPLLPISKIAKKNLKLIFGDKFDDAPIIDGLWDNFGRFIGEFPYVNTMHEEEILTHVEIMGLEHLEHFKKTNQPFLLFTGHFANWDFALRVTSKLYHKFGVVYRKANNPYIDRLISQYRKASHIHLIPKGNHGVKDLLKALKSGYSIAMLVDQKMNDGINVPLLDHPAMTAHAIAKLALNFDYPIVPCRTIRTKGANFQFVIHPPLVINKTGDKESDIYNIMLDINKLLGDWIKQHPQQWFWFHNRWKKFQHTT